VILIRRAIRRIGTRGFNIELQPDSRRGNPTETPLGNRRVASTVEAFCLFCQMIADRSLVPHWIAESDQALAFLDINPIRHGHSLVVPKAHATDLSDVLPEHWHATCELALEVATLLRSRLGTTGENLLVASGPGSEQSVFHLHIHVIPRRSNDDLRWNDWWQTKVRHLEYPELSALAASIRESPDPLQD
jgi:histidine triad (HIT) family protein